MHRLTMGQYDVPFPLVKACAQWRHAAHGKHNRHFYASWLSAPETYSRSMSHQYVFRHSINGISRPLQQQDRKT